MAYRQLQQRSSAPASVRGPSAPVPIYSLKAATSRSGRLEVRAVAEAQRTFSLSSAAPAPLEDISSKLRYLFGKNGDYSARDAYNGTAWSVREKLIDSFNKTHEHWK